VSREEKERILWIWSEGGDVYCLEEGDSKPHDLQIHLYEKDANYKIHIQLADLVEGGYKIEIGRPAILKDDWLIDMAIKKGDKNGTGA
jgi:hypothetical protein